MQLESPNLTYKCSTISPGNPFIIGSKGQKSRSQSLCQSSDQAQYCRCYYILWVFPAVLHRCTNTAGDSEFLLRNFLRPLAGECTVFPGVGSRTLVSACFF